MSVGAALAENEKKTGSTEATEVGRSKWAPYALLTPGGLWLIIFFVVPTVVLFSMSLQTGSLDSGYVMSWHFSTYSAAISQYWPEFLRSFVWAGIATLLCMLIGYPLAYTIAFRAGRWKNAMLVLVIAPFFTSFLIRTLAWETILSDNGWVVSAMNWLHITNALTFVGLGQPGRVLNTPIAVIAGLTYNFLPFMVLPLYASLDRMDPRLVEAGQDLYCSPWRAFRKITFPLSLPGVVAGTLLTFIPATGDYINSTLLGDTGQPMIGNVIDSQFFQVLDYPTASALSFVLMAAILVLVLLYVRQAGTEELI